MIILTIFLAMFDPVASTRIAASAVDARMMRELSRICHRESRCRRVGVHNIDAWASHVAYKRAERVGWVHPTCQPEKRASEAPTRPRDLAPRWSSRGSHGLMAAYHLHLFKVPCLPPEILDIPIFSAMAAALKLKKMCFKKNIHPREKSWGRCNWRKRRVL